MLTFVANVLIDPPDPVLQGAAWVYLLLGAAGQTGGGLEDRVSASSGIASASSSQPWLDDQVSTRYINTHNIV